MDFYSLLEKTTRLQITILDTIYHSNKIWSIEQLAEFTACDKTFLYKIIVNKYAPSPLAISSERKDVIIYF